MSKMTTLLRLRLFTQGRRCFSQIQNKTSVINTIKWNYCKTQMTCTNLATRSFASRATDDKIEQPVTSTLIYEGNMKSFIKTLKLFSLSTSAIGVLGWPVVYFSESFQADASASSVVMLGGIAVYSLSTPLIMHVLTKRYVTHLEYDENNDIYSATIYSLFCREQKVKFQVSDVVRPETPTMFTTVIVKGNPLFFDPMLFKDPLHYGRLMAYDQPIDFKLDEVVGTENEIEKEEPKRMKQSN